MTFSQLFFKKVLTIGHFYVILSIINDWWSFLSTGFHHIIKE